MKGGHVSVVVSFLLLLAAAGEFAGDYSKLSGIIIPGFASTQLRAWSILDCPYSPLDFNPLDLVWLDSTKLLSAVNCWLKCMMLDPYNQTDHSECKSRPDSGLSAITELDPGYITGPLSSVWKEWVKWCIEFGIEANAIIAVPYDWRLSPSKLEERDLYFHKLKLTFETALKLRGGPSIVFAHSLGNNVFRYFLEWLKLEIAPKEYVRWLDDHIHAYFAVGAPLLGATETVKAVLSGATFGLPVSEGTARLMFNTFGSSMWMFPFSKHCTTDNVYWRHFSGGNRKNHVAYRCDEHELRSNYSGWPTNIINIEVPSIRGYEAYPSFEEIVQTNLSGMECGFPTQLSFSAREVSDGTFFKAIKDFDPDSERLLQHLQKSYHADPILNPLTPWERPPLKNIFCIYGIDSKTEVGYYFAPSGKPYPDNWIITDVIYEIEGSLYSRSGNLVEGNPGATSGDETVPYNSLSWCKNWMGPKVNITRTPQSEHDGSDVQVHRNVEHQHGEDIIPNMTRLPTVKYITYYEDSESFPGKRTAVWELDKANHRNIVRSPVLMRELWLEMWHDSHPDKKSNFVTKDDNQNSGGDGCSNSILWGLSFGVVSAIAFKTMSALFPGRTTEQNPAQVMNINVPPISSIDDTSKTMVRVPFHKLIVMHNDCKKSIWNKQCEAYDEIKKLCLGSAAGPTPSDIGRSLLLESFNGCMYKARSSPKEQSACWETYSKLMPTK